MRGISLEGEGLSRTFNRRAIFSGISISLRGSGSLAITGRNGSGKSTLLKIVAGLLSPTTGRVTVTIDGKVVKEGDLFATIGFVAPYLQLYDEFTALENLTMVRRLRGGMVSDESVTDLLQRVGLWERRNDFVRIYSSGMRQRLKYAFALLHRPPILFLDEPTSNLDTEGMRMVYLLMEEQKKEGILLIATNEHEESSMCEKRIEMGVPSEGITH